MTNFIEIDGSLYEGGGQILRTALALSALTKKGFVIKNIRKNRPQKGLKQQHLIAVNVIKEICNAEVKGNFIGSENLEFYPNETEFKNLNIDIETAGSITLLLQALMPVLIFSDKPIKVRIKGGTDVSHSPSIDYFINVFLPFFKEIIDYETELLKRGYYPKGNGDFILKIKPKFNFSFKDFSSFSEFYNFLKEQNKKIIAKKGNLIYIKGISHSSMDLIKNKVSERQAKYAKFVLSNYLLNNKLEVPIKIQTIYNETLSTGSGITLWAFFNSKEDNFNNLKISNDEIKIGTILGSDSLGEKGKRAEIVGKECAENLIKQIESVFDVDSYLGDQLLIYKALFGGSYKCEITGHYKANEYVIERFLS
ncbi:MAG: RNA 3'-terminal phosphate cyclase [Candidatus Woesearchaeota archaeon]